LFSFTSQQIDLWLGTLFWPFVRILALISAAPVLSHRSIPARAKIGLALAFTVILIPTLPASPQISIASAAGLEILVQQMMIGLAIGFSITLAFAAVQLAGDLIGTQMGLGFAWFVDPQSSTQGPMVGSLLSLFATLIFLAIDGHLMMLAAIAKSFAIAPIGSEINVAFDWRKLLNAGASVFSIGLHLALPALAAVFLSNVALGVLTRAAPQLNLFAVGFPITLSLGLLILWLSMPHYGPMLERALQNSLHMFF
jgi:flagellar biosynthesis protein FliR